MSNEITVASSRFGTFTDPAERKITFAEGMIGFPDDHDYVLVKQRPDSVFCWLQSMTNEALAFPVALPWAFYWDYEVRVSDEDLESISAGDAADLTILCVANIGSDVRKGTINLFSPVVINNANQQARQVINTSDGYSTRDPLFRGASDPTPVAVHDDTSPNVVVVGPAAA